MPRQEWLNQNRRTASPRSRSLGLAADERFAVPPEGLMEQHVQELFTEHGGRFELSGVEGVKTQGDIDRIQEALRKERAEHSEARERLRAFDGFDPEETQRLRDENRVRLAGEQRAQERGPEGGQPPRELPADRATAGDRADRDHPAPVVEVLERPDRQLLEADDVRLARRGESHRLFEEGHAAGRVRPAVEDVPGPDQHAQETTLGACSGGAVA